MKVQKFERHRIRGSGVLFFNPRYTLILQVQMQGVFYEGRRQFRDIISTEMIWFFPHWNMEYKGRSLRKRNFLGHVDSSPDITSMIKSWRITWMGDDRNA